MCIQCVYIHVHVYTVHVCLLLHVHVLIGVGEERDQEKQILEKMRKNINMKLRVNSIVDVQYMYM